MAVRNDQRETAVFQQVKCLSFMLAFLYANISDQLEEPTDVFNPIRLKLSFLEVEELAGKCKRGWGSKAALGRLKKSVRTFVDDELQAWDSLIEVNTDFHDCVDRMMTKRGTPEDMYLFADIVLAINLLFFMETMIATRSLEDTDGQIEEVHIDLVEAEVHCMRLVSHHSSITNLFSRVTKASQIMQSYEGILKACNAMVDQAVYTKRTLYHEVLEEAFEHKYDMRKDCEKYGFIESVKRAISRGGGDYTRIQEARMRRLAHDEYEGAIEDLENGLFDTMPEDQLEDYIAMKSKEEEQFYQLLLDISFTMQYLETYWGLNEEKLGISALEFLEKKGSKPLQKDKKDLRNLPKREHLS